MVMAGPPEKPGNARAAGRLHAPGKGPQALAAP